jgi:uncharacterized membrane protein
MQALRKTLPLLTLLVLLVSSAQAATWTAINVPGAAETQAAGINGAGDIVGFYTDSGHVTHGFLLRSGNFTTLDVPGATQTVARGINDSGLIAGYYSTRDRDGLGFLFDGQNFTTLDFPGFAITVANGIDNAGDVVGWYGNGGANPDSHGFKWTNGSFTTIEVGPAGKTILTGINNRGHIVGYSPFSYKSFLINPQGRVRKYNLPGGGLAFGINDHKIIAGSNVDPNFNYGFKLNVISKSLMQLRFRGALWTFCQGINNSGQIVGSYLKKNGTHHGFLRTK